MLPINEMNQLYLATNPDVRRKPNDALRRRLARLGITRTVDGKEFGEVE